LRDIVVCNYRRYKLVNALVASPFSVFVRCEVAEGSQVVKFLQTL